MDALGIARHFRAHDALGVGVVGGAMHAPDAVPADHLDIERADRRAVVRADGGAARDVQSGKRQLERRGWWRPPDGEYGSYRREGRQGHAPAPGNSRYTTEAALLPFRTEPSEF